MAVKTNSNISIDRESIGLLSDYAITLTKKLEEIRVDISKASKYLTSSDNLSGQEVEKFQEAVKVIDTTSAAALAKMEKFGSAVTKLGQRYAGSAATAGRNLDTIREQLSALRQKVDNTK